MRLGCFRTVLLLFALVLLLAGAAAYFFRDRLTTIARERVDRQLQEERLFVDYSLAGDIRPTAITLRNITLYSSSARNDPAATLDHLTLRIALLPSLLNRSPEFVASTQNAKLVVFGAEEPAVWENLSFTYHHTQESRILETLKVQCRGVGLDVAARWAAGRKGPPGAPGAPAGSGPVAAAPSTLPAPPPPAASPTVGSPPASPPGEPLRSSLDPSPLLALAQALDYRKAGFTPGVFLKAEGKRTADDELDWVLSGDFHSFPGRDADLHLDAAWGPEGSGVTKLRDFTLTQGKQQAHLQGTYREAENAFQISQCDSALDWAGIFRGCPFIEADLGAVRTVSPPELTVTGTHVLGEPEKSNLAFSVARCEITYQASADRPPVAIRNLHFQGTLQNGVVTIPSYEATVAEGTASGELSISPFAESLTWNGTCNATNLSLAGLVKPTEKFPAEGTLDLSFVGNGSAGIPTLQGQGQIRISNGRFLNADILGSLLRFLERMAPNFGTGSTDQVSGGYVIRDGVLRTENLLLEVSASRISVKGEVDLASRQTNLEANAKLRGLLSTITQSFTDGQGLVIEGTGPVDKIEWKMKNIGKEKGADASGVTAPGDGSAAPSMATDPAAPGGSLKEQIKQQAMDSLLDGTAEQAVGNLIRGIKERRAMRKQDRETPAAPEN